MGQTTFKLGAWQPNGDTFVAHPASPTGLVMDLNDGTVWSLVDDSGGFGKGLDWGSIPPKAYTSSNPRATGTRVTKRVHQDNRTVKATLLLGPTLTWSAFSTALHNLIQLTEGITAEKPAALQVQTVTGTSVQYFDVIEAHVTTVYKETLWAQYVDDGIQVEFQCRPFVRGPLTTLQNLVANPGAEQGSGSPVVMFNDTYANFSAYTATGGSLTQDKLTYLDTVLADSPVRYYRLDETSGTTFYDATGSGNNGTLNGGITLGTAGLLTGDTDKAATFNGTSGYISGNMTGLPTGASPWSMECIIKYTGSGSFQGAVSFGTIGTIWTNTRAGLGIDNNGHAYCEFKAGGLATSPVVLSTGVNHHLVGTYDGTNVRTYVDGAFIAMSGAATGAITNTGITIGVFIGETNYLSGVIDEVAFYSTALSSARVSAHYTAYTTTPAVTSNTMSIPSGASVSFGSPLWLDINVWQSRFRYTSGMTATWYAHYVDANNYYGFQVTQTALSIISKFFGTAGTTTTATIALVPGMQYWIKITLFPGSFGGQYLQALLYTDSGGAASVLLGTVGPTPYSLDNVYGSRTASSCVIATSGAALGLGGNYSSVHSVSQFGPGGWYFSSSGTGVSNGSWQILSQFYDQDFTLIQFGPVKSYGAARINAPKTGTWNASWTLGNTTSGTTVQLTGVLRPKILKMVAFVNIFNVSTTCTAKLQINEYDINGAYLGTYSVSGASFTCSSSGFYSNNYIPLTGTYTPTGAAYYIIPVLNVADTVSGASSGGYVMWENIQLWDSQKYGAAMPYCEMWFGQSPAQLVVSGLVGDVPSPITLSVGTQIGSNNTLKFAIGRRAFSTANMQMVSPQYSLNGASTGYSGVRFVPVLDSTSYYGYYLSATSLTNAEIPSDWILAISESTLPVGVMQQGIYHYYTRFQSGQSLANIKNVSVTPQISQLGPGSNAVLATRYYPPTTPLSASATWTLADAGQVQMPPFPIGALATYGNTYLSPQLVWSDSTMGASSAKTNYAALLPVDGSKCLATINLPTGYSSYVSILNIYTDGIGTQAGYMTPWTTSGTSNLYSGIYNGLNGYSQSIILGINSADPTSSAGGPGTPSTNTVSINPVGDSFLTVDPTLAPSTIYFTSSLATGTLNNGYATAAMNQFVVIMTDSVGAIYPVYAQLQYVPLYKEVQ